MTSPHAHDVYSFHNLFSVPILLGFENFKNLFHKTLQTSSLRLFYRSGFSKNNPGQWNTWSYSIYYKQCLLSGSCVIMCGKWCLSGVFCLFLVDVSYSVLKKNGFSIVASRTTLLMNCFLMRLQALLVVPCSEFTVRKHVIFALLGRPQT